MDGQGLFIAASRYSRRSVVTARSEQVDFKLPNRQGQLVETVARVVEVGRSSMQVEVALIAEICSAATANFAHAGVS